MGNIFLRESQGTPSGTVVSSGAVKALVGALIPSAVVVVVVVLLCVFAGRKQRAQDERGRTGKSLHIPVRTQS